MNTSSLILSLCAALLVLSGCSTPCESVCSEYNACTVDQRADDVDCATFCGREKQFEESAAKAGADTCKKEFDAHIACWEGNIANICKAEDMKCAASATAWTDCMAKFCAVSHDGPPDPEKPDAGPTVVYDHADDYACDPPDPALSGF